jgi:hypothetical protein
VAIHVPDPQDDRDIFTRRKLAVEPAPDQLHLLGAVAALGEQVSRVLLRPPAVAAGIEQHQGY